MHESLKIMSLKISYYTGLVETVLVLVEPVFLKVKILQKQVINKSASVIFGLVRLTILSYVYIIDRKNISRSARLAAHTLCLQGVLFCKINRVAVGFLVLLDL